MYSNSRYALIKRKADKPRKRDLKKYSTPAVVTRLKAKPAKEEKRRPLARASKAAIKKQVQAFSEYKCDKHWDEIE